MTNKKITIPMSTSDCEEIIAGGTFDWTFDGIDVHIELEKSCDWCGDMDDVEETDKGELICVKCMEKED